MAKLAYIANVQKYDAYELQVLQMVWCLVALDWATAVAEIQILQESLFTHCVSTEVRRCGGIPNIQPCGLGIKLSIYTLQNLDSSC